MMISFTCLEVLPKVHGDLVEKYKYCSSLTLVDNDIFMLTHKVSKFFNKAVTTEASLADSALYDKIESYRS